MSNSRAISSFFFTDCGDGQFSCKQCDKVRKQTPGTGYTNIISHLAAKHPGYTETYDESQRTHGQSLEAHGFVDQRTMEIFKWMEWIVARNHALSEVDDPLAGTGETHLVEDVDAVHAPRGCQRWGENRGGHERPIWTHV
ncbi:hypothetical protein PI126_g9639 [Phytophthora idaei]|nr:hypothetical protein PI126_g9639 [Phytophthora idaei]